MFLWDPIWPITASFPSLLRTLLIMMVQSCLERKAGSLGSWGAMERGYSV